MSNIVILNPFPIAAVGIQGLVGTGGANLLTPDPKEVWDAGAVGNSQIDFDLGEARDVDTFFLGFTNATVAATVQLQTKTSLASDVGSGDLTSVKPLRASDSKGPRHHGFYRLAAPVNSRFFRIAVAQTGTVPLQAGVLMAGVAFQPTHNQEWGAGRQVIDTGTKEPLLGGGFGIGEGARKARYRFMLGDLLPDEVDELYALALDRGETRPALVVEDPDQTSGLNEAIHYGLFHSLQAYERANPQQTRWGYSIEQWV